MAADSAVMVIDAAKGVEAQTIKLFKVCTLRHIPIFTFINKMDREARDPFELMENIEEILGIRTFPMNWPIGCGKGFKGVFDRSRRRVLAFEGDGRANGVKMVEEIEAELGDAKLDELIGAENHQKLAEDIELLDGAAEEFDLDAVHHGTLSPVFFGSALTNFGVEPFLKEFLRLTPTPAAPAGFPDRRVGGEPAADHFSGFIFKIQANMNKNHRDRIAFLRICSGKFERGMEAFHVQEGKNIKLATGTSLMADDRAIVSEAYAGDIIGLFDPGIFSIGDTLCTGKPPVQFAGIPTFAPEHFARVTQVDTMKRKQFVKGMEQIAQEGAIQIFRDLGAGMEEVIVGVVGVLQLEVLEYRLKNEYNVDIRMQQLPYEYLRWILNDPDEVDPKHLDLTSDTRPIEDLKGNHLLLFGSSWSINWAEQHNESLRPFGIRQPDVLKAPPEKEEGCIHVEKSAARLHPAEPAGRRKVLCPFESGACGDRRGHRPVQDPQPFRFRRHVGPVHRAVHPVSPVERRLFYVDRQCGAGAAGVPLSGRALHGLDDLLLLCAFVLRQRVRAYLAAGPPR